MGYLKVRGHKVSRQRVRDSLHRVDPEGCELRCRRRIERYYMTYLHILFECITCFGCTCSGQLTLY